MALVLADRVRDTTTTTGTGTVTLSGTAPTGYQNFSVIGNGNTCYYTINAGSQWEVGIGTYLGAGPTLSRDTVLESSNSGSLVNFSAGTKDVFVTYPAEKSISDGYGLLPVANGGTGATTAGGARTALGATTVGGNVFTLTNPSAITFPRFNADNTVSALDAATFRTAIGAGTSSTTGTVTSVSGTGTVNGITLTGTVTSSGSLALGGTLSGVSLTTQVTGTLPVANGGTGTATAFTAGSVVFAGASGVYSQDNANLFWDNTNDRLGVGTSSPGAVLQLNKASGAADLRLSVGGTLYTNIYASSSDVNILSITAIPLILGTNNTESMRILSGGNVGIGVSAVAGGRLQVSGATSDTDGTGLDQGQLLITDSDAATANGLMVGYRFNAGITEYGRIQCRNAVGATNLALQAGGGLVGIGTNNPGYKLDVAAAGTVSSRVYNTASNADAQFIAQNSIGLGAFGINSTGQFLYNNAAIPTLFFTNGTERARIDASGFLLVGTTAPLGGNTSNEFKTTTAGSWPLTLNANDRGLLVRNSAAGSGFYAYFEYNGGTNNGSISWSGGTTSYVTTCDVRVKKNIVDAPDAGALIDAIKVRSWDFKVDNVHWRYGMVAQELLPVAPEAVTVPEDEEKMMGIDYSKLVPMLIKEVQSLRARVAQLEGK